MTRDQILSLPIRDNTRIYRASDTREVFVIVANELPSSAAIVAPSDRFIDSDDLNALLRTSVEGGPDSVTQAEATLTFTTNPAIGTKVVIGSVEYTFAATVATHQVLVGDDLEESISNLAVEINTGLIPNPDVIASFTLPELMIGSTAIGAAGNGISLSTTVAGASWDGAATHGGVSALDPPTIGKICRVGDSAPFDWFLYNGTTWEPVKIDDPAELAEILSFYVQFTDVVNNLTTNEAAKPLSAAMGVALKSQLDNHNHDSRYDPAGAAATALAFAIQRANHTGTQPVASVDGLDAALASKETPAGAQSKADAAQAAAVQRSNHTGTQPTSSVTGLDDALAARVLIADIRNDLISAETNKPLSAAMGKALKDAIDAINTLLGSDNTNLDTLQEIVDFIQLNRDDLDALTIASIAGLQAALDAKETPAGAQAKADAAQAACPPETAATLAAITHSVATLDAIPDAAEFGYLNSVTFNLVKTTWENIKAKLALVFMSRASNLADLSSAAAARGHLGLGTAATTNTGTGATNTILGNDSRLSDARTPTAHKHTSTDVIFTLPKLIESELVAADAVASDFFGNAVSVSDNGLVLAVGIPGRSVRGIVRTYDRIENVWVARATDIVASDAATGDGFGASCSLSSDGLVLAVGALQWENSINNNQGGVYIYDWNGTSWVQRGAVITTSDTATGDQLGASCSLSGNGLILAAGAIGWEGSLSNQGGVYVWDWNGTAWVRRGAVLTPDDAAATDQFGASLDLSTNGLVLAVGSFAWEGAVSNEGALYVFDWSGTAWVQRSLLSAPDPEIAGAFGIACSLNSDGTVLATSAPNKDLTQVDQGQVYVYDWNGAAWVLRYKFTTPEAHLTGSGEKFGASLSLTSDASALMVGSLKQFDSLKGEVYSFQLVLGCIIDSPSIEDHTHSISEVLLLQATLDAKETPAGAQAKVDAARIAGPFKYGLGAITGVVTLNRANGPIQICHHLTGDIEFAAPTNGSEGDTLTIMLSYVTGPLTLNFTGIKIDPAALGLLPISLDNLKAYQIELTFLGGSWVLKDILGPFDQALYP